MARLHYMALPDVGFWTKAMSQVSAQSRPYTDYLWTARKAALASKPVLAWREPSPLEREALDARQQERWEREVQRAKKASRRRDRHVHPKATGTWIILEPAPWRPEEPDDTFEAFFDTRSVYTHPKTPRAFELSRLDFDREARAILLKSPPMKVPEPDTEDDEPLPRPSAETPYGPLLWLKPNTYTLERQIYALEHLQNAPAPRAAPLIRLGTSADWPDLHEVYVPEEAWSFLRPDQIGRLRDGTEDQRRFVSIALATPDFALLEGPPGSGKTTAILELIVQLLRAGKRVMLVASTHVAVDNVLERLLAWQDGLSEEEKVALPVRVGEESRVTSDDLVPFTLGRLKQTWRDELRDFYDKPGDVRREADAARELLRKTLIRSGKKGVESALVRLILDASNLVCGTTIGILQHPAIKEANRGKGSFEPFDVMIIDEASKTTFSEFLVPALHARRWVVVGDIKQLSPYVEEADVSVNLRGLVPLEQADAAVQAYLAGLRGRRRVRSLVAVTEETQELLLAEATAREVAHVFLDKARRRALRGVNRAIPELLYADLVVGSPAALTRMQHRLPPDLVGEAGPLPPLPDWRAARRAYISSQRASGRFTELAEVDWASEIAWRLIRSYELRQNEAERARYEQEVRDLLPKSLDDGWFRWRGIKERYRRKDRDSGEPEPAEAALLRELETIRRVSMPSILELLQSGFERLPGWREPVVLTDGLPSDALRQRLVSLQFQHRMHPHMSAFSREQFYTSPDGAGPGLLQDADGMERRRAWAYPRYARRAQWLEVAPRRRRRGERSRTNANLAEADKLMEELAAFVDWASANPRRGEDGQLAPWEVAVLTFYRGQEAELRDRLRSMAGQHGNSRNFHLPGGRRPAPVHVTLCTVDRFQGHEADLVLLSFVKSGSVGFLNSPNRLNVALTRARFQIVLIGHRAFFSSDRHKSDLLRSLADSEHYRGDIGWEVRP